MSPSDFFHCFNVALLTLVHSTPFRSKESSVDCILSGAKIFANLFALVRSGKLLSVCEKICFSRFAFDSLTLNLHTPITGEISQQEPYFVCLHFLITPVKHVRCSGISLGHFGQGDCF